MAFKRCKISFYPINADECSLKHKAKEDLFLIEIEIVEGYSRRNIVNNRFHVLGIY